MLLEQAGYRVVAMAPPFDDPPHPADHADGGAGEAMRLAASKALSVMGLCRPGDVVLSADTLIVHADGSLAGTPVDREQARNMIRKFVGVTHQVVTGVALLCVAPSPSPTSPECFADVADVAVGNVPDTQIDDYLDTGQWRGKAGGYNLFEREDAGWPIEVTGDRTTVVGLPMTLLAGRLAKLGIEPR